MTLAQLVVVPGIILAILAGAIIILLARLVRGKLAVMAAERKAVEAPMKILREQEDAISAVINAIETDPLVKDAVPADLQERLIKAHENSREITRRRYG